MYYQWTFGLLKFKVDKAKLVTWISGNLAGKFIFHFLFHLEEMSVFNALFFSVGPKSVRIPNQSNLF